MQAFTVRHHDSRGISHGNDCQGEIHSWSCWSDVAGSSDHVCVSHVAGSFVGEEVTVRTELRTIERDRFLTFDVSAHVGERLLGEGTHQRAVIDLSRLRRSAG